MYDNIEDRAKILASYIIENKSTVRSTAKKFNVSKSTVHKDIAERLEKFNPTLAILAKDVLKINKSERHIRGGLATKYKYQIKKEHQKAV
ncbi:MAG: sporulation transcriptional regulator SpoIIID [Clostridia bacterium]